MHICKVFAYVIWVHSIREYKAEKKDQEVKSQFFPVIKNYAVVALMCQSAALLIHSVVTLVLWEAATKSMLIFPLFFIFFFIHGILFVRLSLQSRKPIIFSNSFSLENECCFYIEIVLHGNTF